MSHSGCTNLHSHQQLTVGPSPQILIFQQLWSFWEESLGILKVWGDPSWRLYPVFLWHLEVLIKFNYTPEPFICLREIVFQVPRPRFNLAISRLAIELLGSVCTEEETLCLYVLWFSRTPSRPANGLVYWKGFLIWYNPVRLLSLAHPAFRVLYEVSSSRPMSRGFCSLEWLWMFAPTVAG